MTPDRASCSYASSAGISNIDSLSSHRIDISTLRPLTCATLSLSWKSSRFNLSSKLFSVTSATSLDAGGESTTASQPTTVLVSGDTCRDAQRACSSSDHDSDVTQSSACWLAKMYSVLKQQCTRVIGATDTDIAPSPASRPPYGLPLTGSQSTTFLLEGLVSTIAHRCPSPSSPMQTYASSPKPRKSEHRSMASSSPVPALLAMMVGAVHQTSSARVTEVETSEAEFDWVSTA